MLLILYANRVNLYQVGTDQSDPIPGFRWRTNMPITMNGHKYYRTSETCRMVGISKTTLLRWLRQGHLKLPEHRDRREWRLFTEDDVNVLNQEANRVTTNR